MARRYEFSRRDARGDCCHGRLCKAQKVAMVVDYGLYCSLRSNRTRRRAGRKLHQRRALGAGCGSAIALGDGVSPKRILHSQAPITDLSVSTRGATVVFGLVVVCQKAKAHRVRLRRVFDGVRIPKIHS